MLFIVMIEGTQPRSFYVGFIVSRVPELAFFFFTKSFSSPRFRSVVPHPCVRILLHYCILYLSISSISASCILTSVAVCVNEASVAAQINQHLTLLPPSSALPLL